MRMPAHSRALLIGLFVLLAVPTRAGVVVYLPLDASSNSIPVGRASFVRGVVGDPVAISPGTEALVVQAGVANLRLSPVAPISCWFKAGDPPEGEFLNVEAGADAG